MPITINGTGSITGLTAGGLPDGSVVAADLASGAITAGALPAGSILQVVQTVKTSQYLYNNSQAFADIPGFNVSITPASADNKILVFVNLNVSGFTSHHLQMRLLRGSTDIFIGDADGSKTRCTFHIRDTQSYNILNYSGQFLDSPSTTSSVTYKMQIGAPYSPYSARINAPATLDDSSYSGLTASTITAMEIAA